MSSADGDNSSVLQRKKDYAKSAGVEGGWLVVVAPQQPKSAADGKPAPTKQQPSKPQQHQQQPPLQLSPAASAFSSWLFSSLDSTHKGYLSPEEVGFALSLFPQRHVLFNAALATVERRVGGENEKEREEWREKMGLRGDANVLLPSIPSLPMLRLPGSREDFLGVARSSPASSRRSFFSSFSSFSSSSATAAAAAAAAAVSFPSPPPPAVVTASLRFSSPLWNRMGSEHYITPARIVQESSAVEPMQRQVFEKYYSVYWNAFYIARFSSSSSSPPLAAGKENAATLLDPSSLRACTPAQFDSLLLEQFSHRPLQGMRWAQACIDVLTGAKQHPLAVLMKEHDEGRRQGYKGRMQQAALVRRRVAPAANTSQTGIDKNACFLGGF